MPLFQIDPCSLLHASISTSNLHSYLKQAQESAQPEIDWQRIVFHFGNTARFSIECPWMESFEQLDQRHRDYLALESTRYPLP